MRRMLAAIAHRTGALFRRRPRRRSTYVEPVDAPDEIVFVL